MCQFEIRSAVALYYFVARGDLSAASVLKEQSDIRGIYALFTLWLQVKLEDQYHSHISLLNIKTAARAWLD